VCHKFFLFALLLSLACCSGRTRISLGGTPTSVIVDLLPPMSKIPGKRPFRRGSTQTKKDQLSAVFAILLRGRRQLLPNNLGMSMTISGNRSAICATIPQR
jgi:hypothetical protein